MIRVFANLCGALLWQFYCVQMKFTYKKRFIDLSMKTISNLIRTLPIMSKVELYRDIRENFNTLQEEHSLLTGL